MTRSSLRAGSIAPWWFLLCTILLIGLLVFSACSREVDPLETVTARGKLIAGVKYDSRPFGYLDTDGQLKGYDIDLMRELARRLLGSADAVEFQQVFSSTRVIAINSGSVDVVAATMTITPDREKVIDFSRPYFMAHQAVIIPMNSPVKRLEDLTGKTVLFVMGTTSEANIKKLLPDARYLGFKTSTDAFSALKAGRGDAMTTDDTILSGFLLNACGYKLMDKRLSDEPYGLGMRQATGAASGDPLRRKIDGYLQDMERDGTLKRLREKWVDTALKTRSCG